MTEEEAVKAIKNDDKTAFKYLFESYYHRLVSYIITYNHNHIQAEDIVQQAFINLWDNRSKIDESKSPSAYLYAIARNQFLDADKNYKRRGEMRNKVWQKALRDRIIEDAEQLEKRIEKMKVVIDSLPPKCKEIIQMNKIQGMKYHEIAAAKNISVKTVESQMRIAFKKIRKAYKKNPFVALFLLSNKALQIIID